ncbi:MAG TPA: succinate dehydrogenase assembly factor 2 [Gallionellaceae bacterium]|nr:succinate dehydrogenase assembly factor 2 [Gallionellaceae bacterium]
MLREFARQLRRNMTDAERLLWRQLRSQRMAGAKFRRQQPIGKYIVDFVCFEARLVIELDGGQHAESESDRVRDDWLGSQGFTVLRFWNNEVFKQTEAVMEKIAQALTPSPQPLSHEGRGDLYVDKAILERLRWRCRRGMLELDIVLERFVSRYAELDEQQKMAFDELLDLPDTTLWDMISGKAPAGRPAQVALLAMMNAA